MIDPLVFVLLTVFFVLVVAVLWTLFYRSRSFDLDQRSLNYVQAHWIRILDTASGNIGFAIMEADKLLHYVLKKHGFDGTVADCLKKSEKYLADKEAVWFAHKLRNRLAHELTDVPKREGQRALKGFKKALNDLGANL